MIRFVFCFRLLSVKPVPPEERPTLNDDIAEFGAIWIQYIDQKVPPKVDTLTIIVPKSIEALDGHCGSLSE